MILIIIFIIRTYLGVSFNGIVKNLQPLTIFRCALACRAYRFYSPQVPDLCACGNDFDMSSLSICEVCASGVGKCAPSNETVAVYRLSETIASIFLWMFIFIFKYGPRISICAV